MELRNVLQCGLATVAVMAFASCGGGAQPAAPPSISPKPPAVKTDGHDGHGHEAKGEERCIAIDIGDHEFLGDLDFDSATGTAVLTVNDHHTGRPHPHAKTEAMLNVVLESGTTQVPLVPDPAKDDPEGKTSRYRATAPVLKGVKTLKGRVNLTIDGKAYICDLSRRH